MARADGVQPSEFWAMSMAELWLLWELRRPRETFGNLDETEAAELYAMLKEDRDEETS